MYVKINYLFTESLKIILPAFNNNNIVLNIIIIQPLKQLHKIIIFIQYLILWKHVNS